MKEFFSSFFSSANIIGRAKALILMWILLSDCAIFITLLLFQSVNGYVVCIHTQGVASLALGYALIGLSARSNRMQSSMLELLR